MDNKKKYKDKIKNRRESLKIFTIGFTKTTAESFFSRLKKAGVKKVIDVRLNNTSQLAGFAKKDDLEFFLKTICNIDYEHIPELAPSEEIMDEYKRGNNDWNVYEKRFIELLKIRKIEEKFSPSTFYEACLLCSEDQPEHCHRRLIAEYLKDKWGNLEIIHL